MSKKGKIKSFNVQNGRGIIEVEGMDNVLIEPVPNSFKSGPLPKGEFVEFDVMKINRKEIAINIRKISSPSTASHNKNEILHQSNKKNYLLPKDTAEIINIENIDNFALRLNKASYIDSDGKFKFYITVRRKNILNVKPDYSKIDFSSIAKKHKYNIENSGLKIISSTYNPVWKMVIGIGNESVYETSMTLHQIYGIPFIPGSAIKGITRSFMIKEKFNSSEKNSEQNALKDEQFCDIFGCPKNSYYEESRQGRIYFFDAFPLSKPNIKPDVMNPHYGPYYSDKSGGTPPADYHDPNPIFFLTVENTQFEFVIGIKRNHDYTIQSDDSKEQSLLTVASEWMAKALEEHGIGAKTCVGYGYFDKSNSVSG